MYKVKYFRHGVFSRVCEMPVLIQADKNIVVFDVDHERSYNG